MAVGAEYRELLAADAALMLGVAEARDVALALQRYWERRTAPEASFEAELKRIASLGDEPLRRIRAEVERLLGLAGGDARAALTRHGGLDRSIHLALGRGGGDLSRALSVMGVVLRAPLRTLHEDRYVAFEAAGMGGMGVVYAAVDSEMNRRVAFKMVRPHAERGASEETPSHPLEATRPPKDTPESEVFEQLKARLVQEAWVTGGLEHPGIVPVYEIGQTPTGIPYYTMRYVRGERTLADAIHEKKGPAFEERLALLEPFLKVCDTLRYAHARGVVHRDLKPANVALGQYGEVVLLDWGLARLEGRDDVASSAWQQQVETLRRDAGFHTQEGGAIGTAGYMSPEATLGHLAEVDVRSDVYSLGAMLFEILTGRLPYAFRSFMEYASLLVREDAPSAREVEPSVPEALAALCARALAREKAARPGSAEELADAVRAWQVKSAADREVEALLRDARTALEGADGHTADPRLVQVDRAAAALAQVESKRPESPETRALRRRAQSLREAGLREREQASARRLLKRVAVGALAAAAVAAFVVVTVVEGKRKEAEEARNDADRSRQATEIALGEKAAALEEKARAYDEVLRLADSKRVRDLLDEVEHLWPLEPAKAEAMASWIGKVKDVLANRDGHRARLLEMREAALPYTSQEDERDHGEDRKRLEAGRRRLAEVEREKKELQAAAMEEHWAVLEHESRVLQYELSTSEARIAGRRTWSFADPSIDWQHQVILDLLAGLDRIDGGAQGEGVLTSVERRHEFVSTLADRSLGAPAQAWSETIAGIAASPEYGGLVIAPQLGLVPLGRDPDSGLYEFAHLGSGEVPARDATTGRLVNAEDAAIVLVLLPGGSFNMGAQKHAPSGPNYDPAAVDDELPVRSVILSAFFLGKYEVTQAQWRAMTEGEEPSTYKAGQTFGDQAITDRNPVEQVSWEDCDLWLTRNRLALPTEAQWEYGCRAGTDTPWTTGAHVAALSQAANIADAWLKSHGGASLAVTPEVEDGYAVHAPTGCFTPNAFGLHDVHGNVWEWCRDVDDGRTDSPGQIADPDSHSETDTRVLRGGSWDRIAWNARSSLRFSDDRRSRTRSFGVRAAKPLLR